MKRATFLARYNIFFFLSVLVEVRYKFKDSKFSFSKERSLTSGRNVFLRSTLKNKTQCMCVQECAVCEMLGPFSAR